MSWQWTATREAGTAAKTSLKTRCILPGVPTPIVSPREISKQPIEYLGKRSKTEMKRDKEMKKDKERQIDEERQR